MISSSGSVPIQQRIMLFLIKILEEAVGFMTYRSEGETEGVSTLKALLSCSKKVNYELFSILILVRVFDVCDSS